MKVMTILGTRPEIIRLSEIIRSLDQVCEHTLVHTGQNGDPNLSDVFFRELGMRPPDVLFGIRACSFAEQVSQILVRASEVLQRLRPDRLLLLGDTNSGLAAFVAARIGIPVYHLEAGNRCYDDRVPEEINRRIIDQCSQILMPYTHRSKENLLREGFRRDRIFVIGNPIYEVLTIHADRIETSDVLTRIGIEPGRFFLVTLHRAENVDDPGRLEQLCGGLALVAETFREPIVISVHPHTADRLRSYGMDLLSSEQFRLLDPLGLFDFVKLERHAHCVLTDSGTVQEECALFRVPNVTLRDVTERPETIEIGSNMLTGAAPEMILQSVRLALRTVPSWNPPEEYRVANVAETVTKILLGFRPEF